ncbi:hypothetical protein ACFLYJ_02165 [Candidatus Cloacimonadota bacterium]
MKKNILIGLLYLSFGILSAFEIPFSTEPIKSDTNRISDFFRVSPPDQAISQLTTNAWFWHDDKNLYVLFESEIDGNFVEGKHAAYDGSASADYVRIQLITDEQNYFAYGYYAYPLGSKYDFIRNSELDSDKYWNSRYSYTTEVTDSIWKVIFKIPFSDLRHSKTGPYNWKIVLSRYQKKTREIYNAPFVLTKLGNDYFRNAIDIEIKKDIHQQRKFTFKPYAIFTYDLKDNKTEIDEENLGIDIAYNPTFSTRLKLSLSPDYSDIPMDTVTDTYNSKYPPSFSENRYFFIEDFNAFGVGKELFYSRRILQPLYAFKLTSNNKNYSFGILSSLDKLIEETHYPETDSSYVETINPSDIYNIVAFQPTWDNLRFQFTLLNRINEDYHNEVLHLNPVWEAAKNNYLWSDLNLSLKETDTNTFKGYYGKIGYRSFFSSAQFSLSAQKMSKDYRASMGRIYEDDFFGWNLDFEYTGSTKSNLFKEIEIDFSMSHEMDNDSGVLLERYACLENTISTDYNFDIDFVFNYVRENITPSSSRATFTDKWILGTGIEWVEFNFFRPGLNVNRVRYYFYRLQDSYDGYIFQGKLSGIIDKYISYFCSLDYSVYEDMPDTNLYDDEYMIINFDLIINLSNRLSLSNGIRFDDYEYGVYSQYRGIFSNFKWEINSNCDLFAGIKMAEDTINDKKEIKYSKFYLKLIYIF